MTNRGCSCSDGGKGEGRGAEGVETWAAGAVRHLDHLEAPRFRGWHITRTERHVRVNMIAAVLAVIDMFCASSSPSPEHVFFHMIAG